MSIGILGIDAHRTLRGLLAIAVLAAAVITSSAVVVGSGVEAASVVTYTRSASCAGLDFYPLDSATDYGASGTLRVNLGKAAYYLCDPGLPTGAVVTKVQFTVKDDSDQFSGIRDCALVRSALAVAGVGPADVLASVPDTGGVATPGVVRLTTTTIAFASIDNSRFGYWLQCYIYWLNDDVGIYGADVIYRISAAKG